MNVGEQRRGKLKRLEEHDLQAMAGLIGRQLVIGKGHVAADPKRVGDVANANPRQYRFTDREGVVNLL